MPKSSKRATAQAQFNTSYQYAQVLDGTPALERLCTVIQKHGINADSSLSGGELMLDINVYAFDATGKLESSTLVHPDGTVYLNPDELYELRHVMAGMMIERFEQFKTERFCEGKKDAPLDLSCFVGKGGYGVGHIARHGWYQICASFHPLECDANWWAKNVDKVFTDIRQEYQDALTYISARPESFINPVAGSEQEGGEA